MAYEDRKDVQLNIDDILDNNFLIADLMLVPELRERLESASLTDLSKLLDHFEEKKNAESFANTLKHHYKEYLSNKSPGKYNFDLMIEALKEVVGVGKYEILFKAFYNLFYNYGKQNNAVELFIEELKGMKVDGVLDLATHYPVRFNEEQKKLIERGKNEVRRNAIRVLSGKTISAEVIAEALGMTIEDVKEVLDN